MWITSNNHGLYRFSVETLKFEAHTHSLTENSIATNNINCIINPASVKNKEDQESEWFRLTSNIEIYKCGTDKFLANRMNWDKLTD